MSSPREPEDDGRTVAPMNVEGMPWHSPGAPSPGAPDGAAAPEPLSRAQTRVAAWGVLKAALLVAAVFAGGYLAFILFCTNVWFRG